MTGRLPFAVLALALALAFLSVVGSLGAGGGASRAPTLGGTPVPLVAPHPLPAGLRAASPLAGPAARPSAGNPGSVIDTVVLTNGTVEPGNFLATNAPFPTEMVYDPGDGNMFLLSKNDAVVVWDATNAEFLRTIPIYSYAVGLVADPADQRLFVLTESTDNLSIVDTATMAVSGSTPVGHNPYGAAMDPLNDRLYVSNSQSDNVTIVDAATGMTVGSFGTGTDPYGVAFDQASNCILVANEGSNNVTVYNITQGKVTAQVGVGTDPEPIAVDPVDGLVIVGNNVNAGPSDNVTVFNAHNYGNPQSFTVKRFPQAINVSASGHIYVADYGAGNVSVLDGGSLASGVTNLPVGIDPVGPAYDPATGNEYVTNFGTNNISEISDSTPSIVRTYSTYVGPTSEAYDALQGVYYVAVDTPELYVVSATTHAVLRTVGLPITPVQLLDVANKGELWISGKTFLGAGYVDVLNESTFAIMFQQGVGGTGALAYDVTDSAVCMASSARNVTVLSLASDVGTASIPLPTGMYGSATPGSILWNATNDNLYITNGPTFASVTVVNMASKSVTGEIPTGSIPAGITFDPANGEIYVANEGSNNLTVINPSTGTSTPGAPTGDEPSGIVYDAANRLLYVGNAASNNVSVIDPSDDKPVASLAVGTDPVSLGYASNIGNVSVSNYVSGTVSLIGVTAGTPTTYTVTFSTNPTGCSITFNGQSYADGSYAGGVLGGTYPITANSCTAETFSSWSSTVGALGSSSAASTTLTVGSSGTLTASYAATPYSVTFEVTGGPCSIAFNGQSWTNGQVDTQAVSKVYDLAANTCPGYAFVSWTSSVGALGSATSASTTVDVTASGTIGATFQSAPYSVTFAIQGGPCSVSFDGQSWANTQVDSNLPSQTYDLSANLCPGYNFLSWTSSAGALGSTTSASTTIDLTASGTIGATFQAGTFSVTFSTTGAPCSITFNGQSWTDRQVDSSVTAGTYHLTADSCPGYTFLAWASTAGPVAVADSASTTIDVTNSGTIGAGYAIAPAGGGGGGGGGFNPLTGKLFGIPVPVFYGIAAAGILAAILIAVKFGGASAGAGSAGGGTHGPTTGGSGGQTHGPTTGDSGGQTHGPTTGGNGGQTHGPTTGGSGGQTHGPTTGGSGGGTDGPDSGGSG
jgi:YVTN family beta-propeller protein